MVIDTQYGENEVFESAPSGPDLVIITGMSGAGRTEAMHTLEDMGYFCIDNLPPTLLMNLVALAGIQAGSLRRLAIVCDLRSKEFVPELQGELKRLQDTNVSYRLIFLDASDDVLIRR
ncbi:MAG: RNase adaptor protein RapZ, partial [Coriobacteriales bacterium]|nr:RNase adaptor protein RapZ [Coriobacteriales bacterium]